MFAPGTALSKSIKIERLISKDGGTAAVYLCALTEQSKQKVAVKIAYTNGRDANHENMLLDREAELLSRWDWRHPSIVRIYPIDFHGECEYTLRASELIDAPKYLVMEYLQGGSLRDNMVKIKAFPLEWKLECFYQLLIVVSFLHQKGYAHRDLKPENIMFRQKISADDQPLPVLVDFSLASNGQDHYEVVDNSYTEEYCAPERFMVTRGCDDFANKPLVEDIWSLGVIFYEIITGERLFPSGRDKVRETLIKEGIGKIKDQELLSGMLKMFILGILQKYPEQRPQLYQIIKALEHIWKPPRIFKA
jgi:serine/threonine protein kinase